MDKTDSGITVGRGGRSSSVGRYGRSGWDGSSPHAVDTQYTDTTNSQTVDTQQSHHPSSLSPTPALNTKQTAQQLSQSLDTLFDFPKEVAPANFEPSTDFEIATNSRAVNLTQESTLKTTPQETKEAIKENENTETLAITQFIPWSIPAALFMIVGILIANLGLPWFVCIPWLMAITLPFVLFQKMHAWRYIAILALLIPIGFARYELWNSQSNPLEHLLNQRTTLSGFSDGRYLKVDGYSTRVVMSPQGKVGVGQVTVKGELFLPTGKRNPGGFDYQGYLRRRGIFNQMYVREIVDFQPSAVGFKERLRQGVTNGLGERSAALMQAMTLGVRDDLGDLREIFAASGLAHILALSGLHVGILITALGFALSPLGRTRYPILILTVIGFMFLVGPTPSVMRATFMVVAVLTTLWLGSGRIEAWPALSLAALISLMINPSLLFDLSFQLSYLAVMGILLVASPVMKLLFGEKHTQLKNWDWRVLVIGSMVVSSSAQFLSLPLVLSNFGSLPLFSPIVNVFAIPIAMVLVPLGFVAALVGSVLPPIAFLINQITGILSGTLIQLADIGASLPSLVWGEISAIGYAFYFIAAIALILALHNRLQAWRALLILSTAILCSMTSTTEQQPPELVYLDVGQGDSALIRLPNRVEILMDGGGSPFSEFDIGARTVVPALRALGVDELEMVIASHPDTDHIEGLVSVLERMPVQQLVIGIPKVGKPLFDELIAVAKRKNIEVVEVRRGEVMHLPGARLDFLNPPNEAYAEDNNNSVTFVITIDGQTKDYKALFLGDLADSVEKELAFPDVDIIMAGHHGSPHSTSEQLLRAAQPEQAILSYGRNTYGHPSKKVLDRLESFDVIIQATHEHGAVRIPLR